MAAIQYMLDNPMCTVRDVARSLNVNESTIHNWRKLQIFWDEYHKQCDKKFKSYESLAVKKLIENVEQGNQKAIEYVLDYSGYKSSQDVNVNSDSGFTIEVNINNEGKAES